MNCALCGKANPELLAKLSDSKLGVSMSRAEHLSCFEAAKNHPDGSTCSIRLRTEFMRRYAD